LANIAKEPASKKTDTTYRNTQFHGLRSGGVSRKHALCTMLVDSQIDV